MQQPQHRREHVSRSRGEVFTDSVIAYLGSWRFIILQGIILVVWLLFNAVPFLPHWDPPPFYILLLCMLLQLVCIGPLILLSQNRHSARNRKHNILEDLELKGVLEEGKELLDLSRTLLLLQRQQMTILEALKGKKNAT